MLVALPRIDGVEDADSASDGQRGLTAGLRAAWQGPRAAEVRMLPADLPLAALPPVTYDAVRKTVPWAIDEIDLAPVTYDPLAEPHLVIFGAPSAASRRRCG